MSKLNCSVGDLAITVFCKLPENTGNIVRVKSAVGYRRWGAKEMPLYTWEVEIATEHGWLAYEHSPGYLETKKNGPVPDKYLRRITPPQGNSIEGFGDQERLEIKFREIVPHV
jgi:hypothetical protein